MPEVRLIDKDKIKDMLLAWGKELSENPNAESDIQIDMIRQFYNAVEDFPTIEAEPVKHGRWMLLPNRTAPSKLFRCSECGNVTEHEYFSRNGYYPFCKDCGARMDEPPESEVQKYADQ